MWADDRVTDGSQGLYRLREAGYAHVLGVLVSWLIRALSGEGKLVEFEGSGGVAAVAGTTTRCGGLEAEAIEATGMTVTRVRPWWM